MLYVIPHYIYYVFDYHDKRCLWFQLALYNKDIGDLLRPNPHEPLDQKVLEALSFYRSHTAQIEVIRSDRNLEQVRPLNI